MNDIVDDLRDEWISDKRELCERAADEIERLRKVLRQIETLEANTVPTNTHLCIARNLARTALDG